MSLQVIHIQSAAPPKPALGAPCNGCGVCCLVEPCPVGVLLSGRRTGACAALRWDHTMSQYRCGAITQPKSVTELAFPVFLSAMAPLLSGSLSQVLTRFGPRWIAAGKGCDCSLQVASQSEP